MARKVCCFFLLFFLFWMLEEIHVSMEWRLITESKQICVSPQSRWVQRKQRTQRPLRTHTDLYSQIINKSYNLLSSVCVCAQSTMTMDKYVALTPLLRQARSAATILRQWKMAWNNILMISEPSASITASPVCPALSHTLIYLLCVFVRSFVQFILYSLYDEQHSKAIQIVFWPKRRHNNQQSARWRMKRNEQNNPNRKKLLL